MKKPQKAGRKASGGGNVVIDLGEKIEAKLRRTSMAGKARGGNVKSRGSRKYRPGGWRPGMFGGYRPWYAGSRYGLGEKSIAERIGLPATTRVPGMLTGALIGIGVNRTLLRLSPMVIESRSKLLHDGIAFVAGMVPYLVKRHSPMALGVAIPGLVIFGSTVFDSVLDYIGLAEPSPALSSAGSPANRQTVASARQRLQRVHQRMQPQQGGVPRVVAQPSF